MRFSSSMTPSILTCCFLLLSSPRSYLCMCCLPRQPSSVRFIGLPGQRRIERLLKAVWAHVITPHGNGGSYEGRDHAHIAHTLVHWTECGPRANANERF